MSEVGSASKQVINDLHELRETFGNDYIDVLTPIIEKRIRAGQIISRPLRVSIHLEARQLTILLNFSGAYPRVPLGVQVSVRDDFLCSEAMQQMAEQANQHVSEYGIYPRATELVREIQKDFNDTKFKYGITTPKIE